MSRTCDDWEPTDPRDYDEGTYCCECHHDAVDDDGVCRNCGEDHYAEEENDGKNIHRPRPA